MIVKTKRRPRKELVDEYGGSTRGVSTVWESVVRGRNGRVKFRSGPHANLRTNSGNDWQANVMAGVAHRGESGTATAAAATSLTNTGAAFPTTADINGMTGSYAGHIVAVGPNASGTGSTVYGVITNNTATVLNVDRWVDAGTPFAAGTTPNGTCKYQILPGNAPAWFLALSSTAITPAAGDTTLSGELTSSGFSRANPTTFTHTAASSAVSIANTFTATGTQTINSEANHNASGAAGITVTTGGVMAFESSEPNAPTLVSGDTLAQTCTFNY